jgi:hypothetical protein
MILLSWMIISLNLKAGGHDVFQAIYSYCPLSGDNKENDTLLKLEYPVTNTLPIA